MRSAKLKNLNFNLFDVVWICYHNTELKVSKNYLIFYNLNQRSYFSTLNFIDSRLNMLNKRLLHDHSTIY